MNKLGALELAARVATTFLNIRRNTWIGLGVGVVALLGLLIWAALALIGWDYNRGFAIQGFTQSVQSATPEAELIDYTKGSERMRFNINKKPGGIVSVRIEMTEKATS